MNDKTTFGHHDPEKNASAGKRAPEQFSQKTGSHARPCSSPARTNQQILEERAVALAREPAPERPCESIEVLEFTLAYERYALELHYARQVASLESLTPLPCTPAFVLGIVNLRGSILPVVDLKTFFGLPGKGLTNLDKIIVLQFRQARLGILADSIAGARHVLTADIQPSLPVLSGIRSRYLKGITPERVAIMDVEEIMTSESMMVEEQVAG